MSTIKIIIENPSEPREPKQGDYFWGTGDRCIYLVTGKSGDGTYRLTVLESGREATVRTWPNGFSSLEKLPKGTRFEVTV